MVDDPILIEPAIVENTLGEAFPGLDIDLSSAIGRRRVYKVEFSEFSLTVTTPEHSGMKGKTTFMFRRRIHFKPEDPRARETDVNVFRVQETFEVDQGEALIRRIKWARAYVLGIVMALEVALYERSAGPVADIFR